MADLEMVIKALELCTSKIETRTQVPCETCPYHNREYHGFFGNGSCNARSLQSDILTLLKAQEPRVMTLEEAANAECVFYDWCSRGVRPAKVIRVPYKTGTYRIQRFGDIDEWVHADEYGEYWRCWTALPTEEQRRAIDAQREAAKWE